MANPVINHHFPLSMGHNGTGIHLLYAHLQWFGLDAAHVWWVGLVSWHDPRLNRYLGKWSILTNMFQRGVAQPPISWKIILYRCFQSYVNFGPQVKDNVCSQGYMWNSYYFRQKRRPPDMQFVLKNGIPNPTWYHELCFVHASLTHGQLYGLTIKPYFLMGVPGTMGAPVDQPWLTNFNDQVPGDHGNNQSPNTWWLRVVTLGVDWLLWPF